MKSSFDPRHKRRQHIVEDLFRIDFYDAQGIGDDSKRILEHKNAIDEEITKAAPQFPIDKINRTDLAILRLAIYEMLFEKKEPKKVIIDEAVELAKEFGGETSPAFVNGALGKIDYD